ncbi:KATNB1-like protein 1 [Talpa occidentalis]|uniref:KATNB1-like protein 1 n=1 Tax=Talpa occidentalis TaxID=50954 RepID=UPI00188F6B1A|nr:KATNB1-like protein 1 [Talpa occidentalis]XP_054556193.1 KATNB1-like protein 1 [Talpa occidentalis]XP_054556194.1 KATNB1-like protein 1 [Talpa occidentalis]
MASKTHNVKKRNFCNNIEDHSIDLPRKRTSNFTNKNMKEVKKSPKQLAAYINRTVGQAVKSPDKLHKVIYRRKKVHPFPNPCYRKKQSPTSGDCDMANKENELACAGHLPEKLRPDSRTYVVNSSDSSSPQTENPSSKYSTFFSEVSQDHETMAQVLFSRNLRLNVALTFWRKRSISELVAYLVRIEDLGVVVDCLPVLTNSLQEEKQYISLGCCVDLLPLVKSLLKSKFEEYVIVGLNWLQAVIKRWWSELSSKTEIINDGNIQILKQQLSGLWEQENHLTLVPGYTGNIAKDVDAYLLQLN